MSKTRVVIYTAPGCFFSEQAEQWLRQAGIPYTEIDTAANPKNTAEMVTKAGGTWITPTIIIGQAVGLGFDPAWIKARLKVCAEKGNARPQKHRCGT